ncbi:MAG: citronellyl-CoA synthetase [Halioglobus sp.]|jgi:citronellyl-CoA synthetase
MSLLAKSRETLRVLNEFRKIAPSLPLKMPDDDDLVSLGAMFEDTVERYPDNCMLLFEGRQWSYSQFNAEVNRLAHLFSDRGVSRGDSVAVFMESRAEFVLAMLALVKLGASASLINNSLSGAGLVHCIKATNASRCVVGQECEAVLAQVLGDLDLKAGRDYFWIPDEGAAIAPDWAEDAIAAMTNKSVENLPVTREITAGEPALYIFTSGTTGLPKAAIMPHRKIVAVGQGSGRIGFQVTPEDRLYLCLPIYHLTGMGPGFCGFISCGGSIFLRRSFSASKFWPEVKEFECNSFVYVGELCRYLAMQPVVPEEKNNPLQKMMGNGLRPDVWDDFKNRFDVPRICEMYGASEGNTSFLNLLNKDKTIGAAISKVALVQYDNETGEIARNKSGRCIEVPLGEPGLLLGQINQKARFDGYTNSEATASKIVRDVKRKGDSWFNTGDLIRQIDVGFAMGLKHFQFVDRTGDTFRWRAENVSTNEVAEVLNAHSQIDMANVYGVEVPGTEGRAGMVAFELDDNVELDLEEFQTLVERDLPAYAQPVFIRVLRSTETTMTFKLLKGELREQAFHLDNVGGDIIYLRKPRSKHYEHLDREYYQELVAGDGGY